MRRLVLRSGLRSTCLLGATLLLTTACGPSAPKLTGSAKAYADARDAFNRGSFDRAVELTDSLAYSTPPEQFTERARVLRAVIFSGQVQAFKELADAYFDGSRKGRNFQVSSEYRRQRTDDLQYWARQALALGEVAQQLTKGGAIAKELTLEAPYPTAEGPFNLPDLDRVRDGIPITPEQEEATTVAARRKGVDDALAAIVGGDRSKARTAMSAGPVKVDGADMALFLAKQLLAGAAAFDRKHAQESTKFLALHTAAEEAVKAALAQLKENPNKDQEKRAKQLQDELKSAMKTA